MFFIHQISYILQILIEIKDVAEEEMEEIFLRRWRMRPGTWSIKGGTSTEEEKDSAQSEGSNKRFIFMSVLKIEDNKMLIFK